MSRVNFDCGTHPRPSCWSDFIVIAFLAVVTTPLLCQNQPTPIPNSDSTYQELRNLILAGEAVSVSNLTVKRDAGTFHFHSGTFCFVKPVQGRVTGAVFKGEGIFVLDPPIEIERKSLKLLTKEDEFSEKFTQLVIRFTDSTYDQIKQGGSTSAAGCDNGPLEESQQATRHHLRYNLDARILQDILGGEPGGLFVAFVHGEHYSSKMLYAIDPHGIPEFAHEVIPQRTFSTSSPLAIPLAPEEVVLMTYNELKHGYWAAFHLASEYKTGEARSDQKNATLAIQHQQLDTTIDKNGNLAGEARTSFISQTDGLRVACFNLYRTLRVQSVTAESGEPLSFIQEDKDQDPQFFVILPKPLAAGEKFSVTTTYGGQEAVINAGAGNYYPIARENWYPASASSWFGNYVSFDMTFHIPKGMRIVASGTRVSENTEGGENLSVWKSDAPQPVAGFNLGDFKMEEGKLDKPSYIVQSFANQEPPDWVGTLKHYANGDFVPPAQGRYVIPAPVTLGTMDTTGLNKKALAEGELAVSLYTEYFGPSLFPRLQLTQQPPCTYGQSWPELLWIPICYYFDATVRHQLGLDFGDHGYWKVVTPHEVAHQWWGHTVGFSSYRDQWMSEGFADMSASLYLTLIEKNVKKFINFWDDERDLLLGRDAEGFRAIDAGPLTLGYRMSNSRTGAAITRRLIYPKGAYILHMLRMMMHDRKNGDQRFKEMMQDFVKTYSGKAATTEEFKAIVEKYMTQEMEFDGNHNMSWFFNEYVYGTQLPSYKFEPSFSTGPEGDVFVRLKLTESNVESDFRMLVPIYLEMPDDSIIFLGRARIGGNMTLDQQVALRGLKTKPKRAMINYYDDVLASPN